MTNKNSSLYCLLSAGLLFASAGWANAQEDESVGTPPGEDTGNVEPIEEIADLELQEAVEGLEELEETDQLEPLEETEDLEQQEEDTSLRQELRQDASSLRAEIQARKAVTDAERAAIRQRLREEPKWRVSLDMLIGSSDIRVLETEFIILTEDSFLEDLNVDATTGEELTIETQVAVASIGYRILPFLEISASAGLGSSEIGTDLFLTAEVENPFGGGGSVPIEIDTVFEDEVAGYVYGLGVNAALPIATIRSRGLAAYAGYQANWATMDEGDVHSTTTRASIGLAYPADFESHNGLLYTVGATYGDLNREVNTIREVGSDETQLFLRQEYENPWSIQTSIAIPIKKKASFVIGGSQALSGATSIFASLVFTPGR